MTNKSTSNLSDSMSLSSPPKHSTSQLLMTNLNSHYQPPSCDSEDSVDPAVPAFSASTVLPATDPATTSTDHTTNQHLLHNNVTCYAYPKEGPAHMICVDTGSGPSLMSESCLQQSYPNLSTYPMANQKRLRCIGIGTGSVVTNKCVDVPVRLRDKDNNYVEIATQIHVIPQLKCDMILGVSTLKPNDITLSWSPDEIHVKSHAIPVQTSFEPVPATKEEVLPASILTTKSSVFPLIQRRTKRNIRHVSVYADKTMILEPGQGVNIPVRHRPLPRGKDYLFEPIPQVDIATGQFLTGIQAVIGDDQGAIPMSNFGVTQAKILKGQIIGRVSTLSRNATPTTIDFAFAEVFAGKAHVEPDMPFIVQYPDEEATSKADISDHWGPEFRSRVQDILDRHGNLFRKELGKFKDGIEMPIPFVDESNVSGLKQSPYPLTAKDKKAMNEILDPLLEQGRIQKVPLGIPSAAASPAFVVWKNGKPRVVVDLKRVNTRLYPDAYPLPRQDTILGALGGSIVFSSVDLTKSFFQQGTKPSDWWKTTFVTPHRGQEWLTVSTMGLANTPGFFQHRMETLLSPYLWQFVLVYIDDIIIYSSSLDQHIQHLDQVLTLLEDSGVTLALNKCHFAYPSIQALGHHVSRLGLSTMEEKVSAIRRMAFPANLRDLEVGLGFFGYYRPFVEHFASIARPLVKLKTRGFKGAPIKGRSRKRHSSKTSLRRNRSPSLPTKSTDLSSSIKPDSVQFDMGTGLLYFVNKPEPDRVCIPTTLHRQLFHFAHDSHAHGGINRSLNRLRSSAYMPKMKKLLKAYIDGCPACQLSKPSRQLPFGQLHPVETYKEPLAELSMDFIVGLPMTPDGYNCLLTVTDRFSKYVRLIPGKETWGAKEWANQYHQHIYRSWGLPARIITDRDPRFVSDFWTSLFQRSGVKLGLTAAYHAAANGQDERTNQTVETAIRCLLIGKYEENWSSLIAEVEYALNTAENASTNTTPFELLYGVKPREMLSPLTKTTKYDENANTFIEARNQLRNEVYDAIKLAQAKMAVFFDRKHRAPELTGSAYIKLAKAGTPGYHMPHASSFSAKKVGPFRILKRVGELAYKLELPSSMKIHDTISVIHLEPAKPDPYARSIPPPPPIVTENNEKLYVIEKILRRETQGKETGYRVKWKGYDQTTFESRKRLLEDVPELINRFEKSRPMS